MPDRPLNMDRSRRAVVATRELPWEPSPMAGVWRRKLEREAAEAGQVTSIVRYEAGTRFSPHSHPLGEEIYVLEGVFGDEHGDYPAGSYLRNPPGSRHAPRCDEGCVIFVKLNQFDPRDGQTVQRDTRSLPWQPGLVEGLEVMPLHSFEVEHTALVRWAPGTVFKPHVHPGGEEILVLEGVLEDEDGRYEAGTWLRSPPYSHHHPASPEGCTLLVKTGHIPPAGAD